jgi:hypothetical protein
MTLKKSIGDKGQSALEYFILTIITVTVLLVFSKHQAFLSIQNTCDRFFNESVDRIAPNPHGGGGSSGW